MENSGIDPSVLTWICGGSFAVIAGLVSYIFLDLKGNMRRAYRDIDNLKQGQNDVKSEMLSVSMKMDIVIGVLKNGKSKEILHNIEESRKKYKW